MTTGDPITFLGSLLTAIINVIMASGWVMWFIWIFLALIIYLWLTPQEHRSRNQRV